MINECDVVRDLIPQYAENMVSEGTKQFVEKHCSECEECRKQLDFAFSDLKAENGHQTESKEKIWNNIARRERKKKHTIYIVSFVGSVLLLTLAIFTYSFLIKGNIWFAEVDFGAAKDYANSAQLQEHTHPGKDEVEAAAEAVKKYFRNNFNACILLRLAYDEEYTYDAEYEQCFPESIVFVSDYFILTDPVAGDANRMRKGWRWTVSYDEKNNEWKVVNYGYG